MILRASLARYRASTSRGRVALQSQKRLLCSSTKPSAPKAAASTEVEVLHPDGLSRWPTLTSPQGVLRTFDWIGTISFAASGALTAGSVGMDILGCTVVGTITAVGGGTIRDALLGKTPIFWMLEVEYLLMCLATCAATFIGYEALESAGILDDNGLLMWGTDTFGVGAFCVIGAQNALRLNLNPVVCILAGMFTATFGGVVRDVLCDRPVRILHSKSEIYASTALSGATAYVTVRALGAPPVLRIAAGMGCTVLMRIWAAKSDIRLPLAPWYDGSLKLSLASAPSAPSPDTAAPEKPPGL